MNRQVRQLVLIAMLIAVALAAALRAEPVQACGDTRPIATTHAPTLRTS